MHLGSVDQPSFSEGSYCHRAPGVKLTFSALSALSEGEAAHVRRGGAQIPALTPVGTSSDGQDREGGD